MSATIELLRSLVLPDFPSGSSINYYDGKLYLVGDDAKDILILDNNYHTVNTIPLFDHPEKRIPKSRKADLETSVLVPVNGKMQLLALGSASREERKKIILLPFPELHPPYVQTVYHEAFLQQLKAKGIAELNIEGATLIGNDLILSNRGNHTNPQNHLITTSSHFWEQQHEAPAFVSALVLPATDQAFLGISELCYVPSKDLLLFSLSSEATSNAYDDGAIGSSYIGWIHDITHKRHQPNLPLDGMIDLSVIHAALHHEKIEGICVEAVNGNELVLHLVADNDLGESKLFKVKLLISI